MAAYKITIEKKDTGIYMIVQTDKFGRRFCAGYIMKNTTYPELKWCYYGHEHATRFKTLTECRKHYMRKWMDYDEKFCSMEDAD